MQLVDDDVLEIRKEPRPPRVVRHDARVQHVRVGEQNPSALPRRPSRVVGRVPIVGNRPRAQIGLAHEPAQCFFLIARQRLGRKEIERRRARVGGERLQDWQVVAKALSRGGRCRDHHVLAAGRELERARLMTVELADTALVQRSLDPRCQTGWHFPDARLVRLNQMAPGHVPPGAITAPLLEDFGRPPGPRPWLIHPPQRPRRARCNSPHCAHAQHCTAV